MFKLKTALGRGVCPGTKKIVMVLAILAFSAPAAFADGIVFIGNTTGGPVFNRPEETGASLSLVGTAVPYNVLQFQITIGGFYNFLCLPISPPHYNTFLILYSGGFNPASPLTNFAIANDDTAGVYSEFNFTLNTGVNYFLVTTGFDNGDFGQFHSSIAGPGVIVIGGAPVPEPATLLLLGSGLAGILAKIKRSRRI